MSNRNVLVIAGVVSPCMFLACSSSDDRSPHNIDIRTAPLNLPGIDFACYDVRVENGAATPETVVARGTIGQSLADGDTTTLCSTRFGNGPGGDISYVAPCDAQLANHTVTLWVDGVYTGTPEAPVMIEYQDPCRGGCALPVTCVENADTPVTFNLTIMRPANQGFFDIGVNFDEIFCSAKVDCEYAPGQPIELLHNPANGERGQTAVLAFACTAGPGDTTETILFRDPIVIDCGGIETVLDPTLGEGNVYGPIIADPDPADPIWQYATYFGNEALDCGGASCNKRYWNVAIGFDPAVANCTVTTTAAAADPAMMPLFATPDAATYPFVRYHVPLTDSAGLACSQHPLNGTPAGVKTAYTDIDAPETFCHRLDALGMSSADPADCADATAIASGFTVTTLAGNCTFSTIDCSGYQDGTSDVAQLAYPWGIAVDAGGNVYVADSGNYVIRKVAPDGTVSTLAGIPGVSENTNPADGPGELATFGNPVGVAVDGSGNVYVADSGNYTIRKITPDGFVTTLAGVAGTAGSNDGLGSGALFSNVDGIAAAADGTVYVGDTSNHTIRKITPAGEVTTLAGLAGVGGSDDGVGADARFFGPGPLAVDASGNLFVIDGWNCTVRKITAAGVVSTLAGSPGLCGTIDGIGAAARLDAEYGIAVDGDGMVYVPSYQEHLLRTITPDGVVTTVIGTAGTPGTADGFGQCARLSGPCGVAVDANGVAYIADYDSSLIRKMEFGPIGPGDPAECAVAPTCEPIDVPTLTFHIDAFDTDSMTLSESNVTQINDESGEGNHGFPIDTGGALPKVQFDANAFGAGKGGLYFQKGETIVPMNPGAFDECEFTMFVVARLESFSAWNFLAGKDDYTWGTGYGLESNGSDVGVYLADEPDQRHTIDIDTTYVFSAVLDQTSFRLYLNGAPTPVATHTTNLGDVDTTPYVFSIGGVADPDDAHWNTAGWIGEVIFYRGALSTQDREAVEDALLGKW